MKKRKRKAPSIGKVAKKTVSNLSKKAFDRMYPRSKSDKQKTNAAGEKSGGGFYGEGLNAPVGYAEGFGDVQLPKPKQPRIKGKKRGKYKARGGSILRAGKTALKGGSAALARFIAARYSPKAIAKYQDYAGRLRRSKRLIKQIVKIDDATYRIKGYIIKTDTAGNNPYSCTCPDFSQFSIDARNWLGSKAGPFNPCKHMMAVRDRSKGGKWVCSGGVCTLDPNATEGYTTKAECLEAVRLSNFLGGQCTGINYIIQLSGNGITWITYSQPLAGPIVQFQVFRQSGVWVTYVLTGSGQSGFNTTRNAGVNNSVFVQKRITRENGDVDTGVEGYSCGNPPQDKCPSFP